MKGLKKELIESVKDTMAVMLEQLEAEKNQQDAEQLHHVRVAIKRLRAVSSFMGTLTGKDWEEKGVGLALTHLGQAGGMLRDLQVQTERIRECCDDIRALDAFFSLYKESEINNLEFWSHELEDLESKELEKFIGKVKRGLASFSSKGFVKRLEKWFDKESKGISKLAVKRSSESNRHKLRIRVKRFIYVLDMCGLETEGPLVGSWDMVTLHELEQNLGDWHDWLLLKKSLDRFFSNPEHSLLLSQASYSQLQEKVKSQLEQLDQWITETVSSLEASELTPEEEPKIEIPTEGIQEDTPAPTEG